MYPHKFIRDNVVAPSVLRQVVIVTLPFAVIGVVPEQTREMAQTSKTVAKRRRHDHTLRRWSGQLFTLLLVICLHLGFSLDDFL